MALLLLGTTVFRKVSLNSAAQFAKLRNSPGHIFLIPPHLVYHEDFLH